MGLEVEVVGETNKFDIIVIGGGVAGIMASCIATQSDLKSCFLEKDVPGGKLMFLDAIHNVENLDNVSGKAFAESLFKQATEDVKTNYIFGNVLAIRPKNDLFYLFTEDGQTWEAKAIIIATGTVAKKLNVDGEERYFNHGLTYCVMCDAALTKGMDVALIGSTAHLDELKKYANHIEIFKPDEIKEIQGDGNKVTGLIKKDGSIYKCQYIFVENGFTTSLKFLPSEIKISKDKEVLIDENMHATFPGVFAAGDCTNKGPKLIPNALDQATIAANEAVNYVKSRKW